MQIQWKLFLRWKLSRIFLVIFLQSCSIPIFEDYKINNDQDFSRSGKINLVISETGNLMKAWHGRFSWYEKNCDYFLDLTSPIGFTLASIHINDKMVELKKSNGSTLKFPNTYRLIEHLFGCFVPIDNLKDWFRGIVVPGKHVKNLMRDSHGCITSFDIDDWHIKLSFYDNLGPKFLSMENRTIQKNIFLKIILDSEKN